MTKNELISDIQSCLRFLDNDEENATNNDHIAIIADLELKYLIFMELEGIKAEMERVWKSI